MYNFANILEIGCGDGILSLASAGMWQSNVLATDIAQQAVADTTHNIAAHNMQALVTAIRSNGFLHTLIAQRAPYDLIVCNLLAQPIMQMAPLMKHHLREGGVCLLSGILAWMAEDVERTYLAQGFTRINHWEHSPWQTFAFARQ